MVANYNAGLAKTFPSAPHPLSQLAAELNGKVDASKLIDGIGRSAIGVGVIRWVTKSRKDILGILPMMRLNQISERLRFKSREVYRQATTQYKLFLY